MVQYHSQNQARVGNNNKAKKGPGYFMTLWNHYVLQYSSEQTTRGH